MNWEDCCYCSVTQSCLILCDPLDCSPPDSSLHADSPGKNTEVGCHALLQGSSQLRDQTCISCIAGRFLLAEPPGKPKIQILLPSKGINTSEFETDIISGCGVKAKALNWNQKILIFLLLNERPWRK